jgi:hypothetical protein
MRVRIRLAALSAVCLLSSCATAYQPDGISGGYSDRRLNDNTEQVSFRGDRFTSPETLHSFLLRRCADLTLQNGYNYFELVTPIESSAVVAGAKVDGQFSVSTTIKMFNGKDLASQARAYEAAAVIRSSPVYEGETAEALPNPTLSEGAGRATTSNTSNANVVSAARTTVANPNDLTNDPPAFDRF